MNNNLKFPRPLVMTIPLYVFGFGFPIFHIMASRSQGLEITWGVWCLLFLPILLASTFLVSYFLEVRGYFRERESRKAISEHEKNIRGCAKVIEIKRNHQKKAEFS